MAVDKLVDSSQLDADLTSVANAIRTKGGTSASLAFPADFVSAIGAIPTGGGGGSLDDFLNATLTPIQSGITTVRRYAFGQYWNAEYTVVLPNVTTLDNYAFANTQLKTQIFPLVTSVGSYAFQSCSKIQYMVLPLAASIPQNGFTSCSLLEGVDFGAAASIGSNCFRGCSALNKVVLRKSDAICSLGGSDSFANTPFKSGGTGGTVYIPKALYEHLGDGTSLDYKAASNWATYDGYGTITWAKIEGSIYETKYVDGTTIGS